ncbi:MAG: hypothetical protein LBL47_04800 [Lactobacillus sp.]|nr:hypothetical protein [Lactobacillus sp.]
MKGTEPSWDLFEIDEGVKIQRVKFAHVLSANGSLYLIPSELLVTKSFISFIEAMTEKKVISAEGKHVDFEINGHKRSRTLRKIYFENDPNPWYFHNRTCKLSKRKHLGNIISEYEGTRMITTSEGVVNISITAERISYIVKRKITL